LLAALQRGLPQVPASPLVLVLVSLRAPASPQAPRARAPPQARTQGAAKASRAAQPGAGCTVRPPPSE
jgi:hypothetical protein